MTKARFPNINFENISLDQGLSQSVIQCMIQDYIGFLWIGTQDGLNLYDGKKFTVLRYDSDNKNSLLYNQIKCLYEDKNRNLWIGTDKGLSRYDRSKEIFINYTKDINDKNSISENQIRCFCEDGKGNLWIATYGGGINRYDSDTDSFEHYKPEIAAEFISKKNRINVLFNDSKDNIWVGMWGGGVSIFDFEEKKFNEIILSDKYPEESIINRINHIAEDRSGNIYIATNEGLFFRKENDDKFEHFINDKENGNSISDNLVSCVFEDSEGNIWVGTRENGLNLFDPVEKKFICFKKEKDNTNSLSNNSIHSLMEDKSGIIWVGTFGNGLDKFSKKNKSILHYTSEPHNEFSLSSNLVYAVCEDSDDILWIGTRDSGLNRFDRKKNIFKHFRNDTNNPDSLSNDTIFAITEDEDDILWIATSGGLNKFNRKTEKFKHYKNNPKEINTIGHETITSIVNGSDGIIWLGTIGGGLNKFDKKSEEFTHYRMNPNDENSISSNRIRVLFAENDHTLWIGTEWGGLNKFNIKEEKFYRYKTEENNDSSISENYVMSIYKDEDGFLWVGTLSGGFNKFDTNNGKFKRFSVKDGLSNDTVIGILEDNEHNIWLSTNFGLSRFDKQTERFKNFDVRDGFQSNEFNQSSYLKLKSGELFFGGVNGFNIFSPDEIKDNSFIPPTVITNFLIFNKPAEISVNGSVLKKSIILENEIDMTYRESVFSFEFASLDFTIPGKNQYAYKMEGFDKDWVYTGNRGFATYTNLDPGEYLFRVKSSNNDGIWNEEGKKLKIRISPPFWKTIWFKGLGALALAGTAGSVYKNKLNKIKKEQKAQGEFTKKLLEVQENDRKRISAELHDSIGSDLLITKNKLLMSLKKPDDNEYIIKNINEVTEIISDTLKDVREISYTLHPYQIERLGLSKAIQSISDRASRSTEINFTCSADSIDKLLNPEVEISLYRIVQECINNVVKHSKADEVILNVNKDKESISVMISDNGIGFSREKIKKESDKHGFGLRGISERVKLFGGKFLIETSPGNGTEFKIIVPIEKGMRNKLI